MAPPESAMMMPRLLTSRQETNKLYSVKSYLLAISLDFYRRAGFDIRGILAAGGLSSNAVTENHSISPRLFSNVALPRLSIIDHPAFVTRAFQGLLSRISQPTNFQRTHVSSMSNKKINKKKGDLMLDEGTEKRLWSTFVTRVFSALAWCIYGEEDESDASSPVKKW